MVAAPAAPATTAPVAAPAATAPAAAAPLAGSDSHPSSALAIAAADAYRALGSRAIARCTIWSSGCGTPARSADGRGGGVVSRAIAIAAAPSPPNGRVPVSASNRTMPSEYTSDAAVASSPRACSGLK